MMDDRHDQIPEIALDWHRQGRGAVLATVVGTWGSAPRQAGSQLVVSGASEIMGSVSGGCVEGAVVAEALAALQDGQNRLLSYGVSDETAFNVGLACGGTITILVEPVGVGQGLPVALLEQLVEARASRLPLAVTVDVTTWERAAVTPATADEAIVARFRADRSGLAEDNRFIAIHNPRLRLIVVGAVHIAQGLLPMARLAGFDTHLIDPREAFASDLRFPGQTLVHDWPDEALTALRPDARTAIVTLTHDSKLDDPAIQAALASDCFYLGCLGSSRTHAKRLERLRAAGHSEAQIARIHAPVGLDIGARTPAEIAVSILGQIIARLRQG